MLRLVVWDAVESGLWGVPERGDVLFRFAGWASESARQELHTRFRLRRHARPDIGTDGVSPRDVLCQVQTSLDK